MNDDEAYCAYIEDIKRKLAKEQLRWMGVASTEDLEAIEVMYLDLARDVWIMRHGAQ